MRSSSGQLEGEDVEGGAVRRRQLAAVDPGQLLMHLVQHRVLARTT
ncbi:hypothetical protein LP420_32340 [Massilia sp. B-10]|nr:hypothetical protein LP420_32340 [Massilia sp. B-10]